jgi:ubiquinone/menaquinone biosynthesis C-methylase UbiE
MQRLSLREAQTEAGETAAPTSAGATPVNPAVDWANLPLPDAWPDQVQWRRPRHWQYLWRKLRGTVKERVRLPPDLPGRDQLPPYLLLEFHNIPNGNYSRHLTRGYSRGFDIAMLGTLAEGRRRIANELRGAERALDLGSGAGHLAGAMQGAGIRDVWGLEPSPYLLQIAAGTYPGVTWQQGIGEASGLPDAHFDAVGICFVLHEIPPHYTDKLLAELHRITRPGAKLVVLEPSALQWRNGAARMWKSHGWRGVYFRLLAQLVYEPYVEAWHGIDVNALWRQHGFTVVQDQTGCPYRYIVARRN